MTRVVIDAVMRTKLGNLVETVEITDEAGRTLGHFVPSSHKFRWEPQISEEELDRRLREGGGRSLKEIMADLEKRA